ncbi:MAG: hypothetical protein R2771_04605 [Saprospiraceae bacterium]
MPPEDLGLFEVCENDLQQGFDPDDWEGGTLFSAGQYSTTLNDQFGCTYDQLVEIVEIPLTGRTIDTVGCVGTPMIIFDEEYVSDISNEIVVVPNPNPDECDLRDTINIKFLEIRGYIDAQCSGDPTKPIKIVFYPDYISSVVGQTIEVNWYWNGSQITDDDPSTPYEINVADDGDYSVEFVLGVPSYGIYCDFTEFDELTIELAEFLPEAPEANAWDTEICSSSSDNWYYSIISNSSDYTYHWIYPDDVTSAVVDNNGLGITINWYGSSGGDLCYYAYNEECGSSDTICTPIEITPGPDALFSIVDTICLTDVATIEYTGSGSSDATYTMELWWRYSRKWYGGVGLVHECHGQLQEINSFAWK